MMTLDLSKMKKLLFSKLIIFMDKIILEKFIISS